MRKYITIQNILLIGLFAVTLIISWIRLFFGVDITDEAFYVAEPYILSHGAIPIVNIWSQTPTFTIITAPIIHFYTKITGDTEGIILFMRFAYSTFKVIIAVTVFMLMKKYIKQSIIIMFLLPFIIFTSGIPSLSYNTMSIMLLMLSGFFTIAAFLEESRKYRRLYASLGGIVMALSVLSYPAQIITCTVVCIVILILNKKKHRSIEITGAYCISGLFVSLIVTLMLCIRGGGIENLIFGLQTIIYDNPYFLLGENVLTNNIKSLMQIFKIFKKFLLVFLTIISLLTIKNRIQRKPIDKYTIRIFVVLSLIISGIVFIGVICITGYKSNIIINLVCAIMFPLPIIFMIAIKEKKEIYFWMLWFIWLPSLLWLITTAIFVWNGINSRYYALFAGALLSIPFSTFALDDIKISSIIEIKSKHILSIFLALMFTISFGINHYMYIYRDNPINELRYRINSGIYAGMYTTRERGMAIEVLESKLKELTKENETVLFMETVPMAYLMSKAVPCTPSTWDITLYSYGFNDDTLYQKYFDITDNVPDKIIYIYTGRDEVLSIDKEAYRFNDFVNKHYTLIYESDEPLYYIKVYGRNNT